MSGSTFPTFRLQLQNFLNNFYDPGFQLEEVLGEVLSSGQPLSLDDARSMVTDAIEDIDIQTGDELVTKANRMYQLLRLRFIAGLSQELAAEKLQISSRHLRRLQVEAVHVLAQRLWQKYKSEKPLENMEVPTSELGLSTGLASSILAEFQALRQNTPEAVSDAGSVLARVVQLSGFISGISRVRMAISTIPGACTIAVHPTALQQVLLQFIHLLVESGYEGSVQLAWQREADDVAIHILLEGDQPVSAEAMAFLQLVAPEIGAEIAESLKAGAGVGLVFHQAAPELVLTIDDNDQIIDLYRRYTANTRFLIHGAKDQAEIFATLRSYHVAIILLDVLMPETDGWDLLQKLRAHPDAKGIPLGVCSVLGSEEMALAMGADFYLQKPVERDAFLKALNKSAAQT